MTRPRKQTVDWFPHQTNHGQTMFILEDNFGNDGYSFWFKLLEVLGNHEGHFVDFNNSLSQRFLSSKARIPIEKCEEMLNLLAELEAICPELWEEKIIWSDNFVAGLAPLYRNRNTGIPVKPDIKRKKPPDKGYKANKSDKVVEVVEEGQEGQEKDIALPGPPISAVKLFFSCQFFDVDLEYRMKLATEFPALPDGLLLQEFSKMEDWVIDNRKKKKFTAKGQLLNPRAFIKNWLKRVTVDGSTIFGHEPKGAAAIREFLRGEADHG